MMSHAQLLPSPRDPRFVPEIVVKNVTDGVGARHIAIVDLQGVTEGGAYRGRLPDDESGRPGDLPGTHIRRKRSLPRTRGVPEQSHRHTRIQT